MINRIVISILFCAVIALAGEPALEYNLYKHQLIEESYAHTDSLQTIEIQKKSVGRAALYSAVLPGAGQYYNGSIWKTILFAGIEVAAWTAYIVNDSKGQQSDTDMRGYADVHWSEHKYWSWVYDKAVQNNIENIPDYTLTERDETTDCLPC